MFKRIPTSKLLPGHIIVLYRGFTGALYFDENPSILEDKVFYYVLKHPKYDHGSDDYEIETMIGNLMCFDNFVDILNVEN